MAVEQIEMQFPKEDKVNPRGLPMSVVEIVREICSPENVRDRAHRRLKNALVDLKVQFREFVSIPSSRLMDLLDDNEIGEITRYIGAHLEDIGGEEHIVTTSETRDYTNKRINDLVAYIYGYSGML